MRSAPALSGIAMLVAALACSPAEPGEGARSTELPATEPYIRGTITAVDAGRVRVEENPEESSGSAKAELRLTDRTRILRRSGGAASLADLRIGQEVSAWVVGPVAESYPVQADAGTLVIAGVPRDVP